MLPPAGGFDATSPGQDPWTMAFDDDGRIFTQVHHKYGFNGSLPSNVAREPVRGVRTGAVSATSSDPVPPKATSGRHSTRTSGSTRPMIVSGTRRGRGRRYTFDVSTGRVLCANVSIPPLGQCTGGSWVSGASSVANFSNLYPSTAVVAYWGVSLRIIGNKLWVLARESGASTARLACPDPLTGEFCSGWTTSVGAITTNR